MKGTSTIKTTYFPESWSPFSDVVTASAAVVLCILKWFCTYVLLSSGSEGLLKLWTIKTNECIKTFDQHLDKVTVVLNIKSEIKPSKNRKEFNNIKYLEKIM